MEQDKFQMQLPTAASLAAAPLDNESRLLCISRLCHSGEDSDRRTVAVLGVTGHGKSTFLNFICQKEKFKVPKSKIASNSITLKTENQVVVIDGQPLNLIDTPGLFDTNRMEMDVKQQIDAQKSVDNEGGALLSELKRAFVLAGEDIHAFLLVYNPTTRWSLEMTRTVQLLERIQFSWDHTILVITHADLILDSDDIEEDPQAEFDEYLKGDDCAEGLRDIVKKVNRRVLLVESVTRKDSKYHTKVTQNLLSVMNNIVHEKGSYKNECFLQVQLRADKALLDLCKFHDIEKVAKEIENDKQCKGYFQNLRAVGRDLIVSLQELNKVLRLASAKLNKLDKVVRRQKGFGAFALVIGIGITAAGIVAIPFTLGGSGHVAIMGACNVMRGALSLISAKQYLKRGLEEMDTGTALASMTIIHEVALKQKCLFVSFTALRSKVQEYTKDFKLEDAENALLAKFASSSLKLDEDESIARINRSAQELQEFQKLINLDISSTYSEQYKMIAGFLDFNSCVSMKNLNILEIASNSFEMSKKMGQPAGSFLCNAADMFEKEIKAINGFCEPYIMVAL